MIIIIIKLLSTEYNTVKKGPKLIWDKLTAIDFNIMDSSNRMQLLLYPKNGLVIANESECPYETMISKIIPSGYSTSQICTKGVCDIVVSFNDTIPKEIHLNIEEKRTKRCSLKEYKVKDKMRTIGYELKLPITDELKQSLGVHTKSCNINFRHANSFTRSLVQGEEEMLFQFKSLRKFDTLMLDNKEKFKVDFVLK